jgi:hypothetical protein
MCTFFHLIAYENYARDEIQIGNERPQGSLKGKPVKQKRFCFILEILLGILCLAELVQSSITEFHTYAAYFDIA